MSNARGFHLHDSIFSRTLLMVFTTVLLLTAVNVGIVLLRAPPFMAPITANEIARALKGKSIANKQGLIRREVSQLPAEFEQADRSDLIGWAVARRIGVTPDQIRVARFSPGGRRPPVFDEQLRNEFKTYAADGDFNPLVFGPFAVARREATGWTVITSGPSPDSFSTWQQGVIGRFLMSLLVVLPVAWLFARRLSRPIQSFADAAENLGRHRFAEPVAIQGPMEIRQASAALNDMQIRLRRYVTERTSMIGAIAHDLRTPLSRLHFHLTRAPDDIRSRAENEIGEMERLIASALDFVENDSRRTAQEQIDLGLLVEGVVDDFADLGHDVMTVRNEGATVTGDPILLKRLFSNLITNAIKYGGRAEVRLYQLGGEVTVEIADHGPGLAHADLERAFEPFYRVETSRNRSTGGIGLGLAIVKAATEVHNGSVSLKNRPEGGLVASVSLPLAK